MPTFIYRDVKKYRYLPIKEVAVLLLNNDIVRFGELREGSKFTIEPIIVKTDSGLELPVAYRANIDVELLQNNNQGMQSHLNNIATGGVKGVRVWFNLNYTLNTEPNGEMLLFSTFDDEQTYNLDVSSKVTYDYNNTPITKFTITALLTANQATNRWYELNWQNLTW